MEVEEEKILISTMCVSHELTPSSSREENGDSHEKRKRGKIKTIVMVRFRTLEIEFFVFKTMVQ